MFASQKWTEKEQEDGLTPLRVGSRVAWWPALSTLTDRVDGKEFPRSIYAFWQTARQAGGAPALRSTRVTQCLQLVPGLAHTFAAAVPVHGRECTAVDVVEPVFLTLSSLQGKKARDKAVTLDPTVFKHPIRRDILHLCAVHHLDSLRQGSANTKTRGEVRGSGRKIRPQKGTGRARLGDGQSPMLRGGGVAFGPKPRDFSTKLNRKVIEMGMRVALSAKFKEQRLGVVPRIKWYCHKTITLKNRLETLGWRTGTLFVSGLPQVDPAIHRAGRNLRGLEFKHVDELNVYDLVKWRRVILDLPAVALLESKLSRKLVGRPGLPVAEEAVGSTSM